VTRWATSARDCRPDQTAREEIKLCATPGTASPGRRSDGKTYARDACVTAVVSWRAFKHIKSATRCDGRPAHRNQISFTNHSAIEIKMIHSGKCRRRESSRGIFVRAFCAATSIWYALLEDLAIEDDAETEIAATLPRADARDLLLVPESRWREIDWTGAMSILTSFAPSQLQPQFVPGYSFADATARVEFHRRAQATCRRASASFFN